MSCAMIEREDDLLGIVACKAVGSVESSDYPRLSCTIIDGEVFVTDIAPDRQATRTPARTDFVDK
jgi:hypothetical protein